MDLKREPTLRVTLKIRWNKIFIILFLLSLISVSLGALFSPVTARSRRTHLTDFILNNRIENKGYSNSILEEHYVSEQSTYYALKMLEDLDLLETQEDLDILATTLAQNVQTELDEYDDNSLITLYYLLHSLSVLDSLDEISTDNKNEIINWINLSIHENGGFKNFNSSLPTVFNTYFSVKVLYLLSSENIFDSQNHTEWIISCNNSDGGFGGNSTLNSSIISTYYAVLGVNNLTDISDLSLQNESIIQYIMESYNSDIADSLNYGGFSQTDSPTKSLISTTFYCVSTVNLLDSNQLDSETILQWILKSQNPIDGGFSESKSDGSTSYSSMITTYYAFNIIKYLDPDFFSLNEDVWDVEFNWVILIILILIIIAAPTIVIFIIWRKRKV